jgi:hypothetical protein
MSRVRQQISRSKTCVACKQNGTTWRVPDHTFCVPNTSHDLHQLLQGGKFTWLNQTKNQPLIPTLRSLSTMDHAHLGTDTCTAFLSRVSPAFARTPPTPGVRSPHPPEDLRRFHAIAGKSAVVVFADEPEVTRDPILGAHPNITAANYAHVKNHQNPGGNWTAISEAFNVHDHPRPSAAEVCQGSLPFVRFLVVFDFFTMCHDVCVFVVYHL